MDSLADVASLMRANLPPGVTPREFGQDIMQWGSGSAEARTRMTTLSANELQLTGFTAEMAESWARAYESVARLMPNNPSAAGRAELMWYAAKLLRGA